MLPVRSMLADGASACKFHKMYPDIRKVGVNLPVDNSVSRSRALLPLCLNPELLPCDGMGAFTTEEISGVDAPFRRIIATLHVNCYRIVAVKSLIDIKGLECPGPINCDAMFRKIINKETFNETLMQIHRMGVPSIDGGRAGWQTGHTREFVTGGDPKVEYATYARFVLSHGTFEAHVG